MGISFCHIVPASMKATTYKVQTTFTKDKLIHASRSCKIGGNRDDKITCVHTLVLPYLLTVLLTSGYLAEHLLLELANTWKQEFDISLEPRSILSIKDSITKLMVATGRFETDSVKCNSKQKVSLILQEFMVGTEKTKTGPIGFTDLSLMCPICNLPISARKSICKRAIEATNLVGIQKMSKKARLFLKVTKEKIRK